MAQQGQFRGDLDLSEFISHYQPFMTGSEKVMYTGLDAFEDMSNFEPIPGALREEHDAFTMADPILTKVGPLTCSTSREMAPYRRSFSWDVNGYYRALGVPWPYTDASSGTISKCYIAADGQSSPMKTYFLKQLLNKGIRAEYDASQLGQPYLNDVFIQRLLKQRAKLLAEKRSAAGKLTTEKEVLAEWDMNFIEGQTDEAIDTTSSGAQDRPSPEDYLLASRWKYSYWRWRSHKGTLDQLADWQSLLIAALSEAGARIDLAIGYLGKQPHPYVTGFFDGQQVLFIHEDLVPNEEIAASAAKALLDALYPNPR